jgi:integrase
MDYRDLPALMARLRETSSMTARALEFLILTACRSGEVRYATWDEVDFDAGLWTIPGGRMKAGRAHQVPLSPSTLDLLKAMRGHWLARPACLSGARAWQASRRGGHDTHARTDAGRCDGARLPLGVPRLGG